MNEFMYWEHGSDVNRVLGTHALREETRKAVFKNSSWRENRIRRTMRSLLHCALMRDLEILRRYFHPPWQTRCIEGFSLYWFPIFDILYWYPLLSSSIVFLYCLPLLSSSISSIPPPLLLPLRQPCSIRECKWWMNAWIWSPVDFCITALLHYYITTLFLWTPHIH